MYEWVSGAFCYIFVSAYSVITPHDLPPSFCEDRIFLGVSSVNVDNRMGVTQHNFLRIRNTIDRCYAAEKNIFFVWFMWRMMPEKSLCVLAVWSLCFSTDICWDRRAGTIREENLYVYSLQWHHNGCDGVLSHQPYDCLLNRLSKRRSKKTPKLCVTGLCAGNSPVTGKFPVQMASNAENVSIWWRHHV